LKDNCVFYGHSWSWVFEKFNEVPKNRNSTFNPQRLKEAERWFQYPRQEGASSLFSSEMREDGGNMD
jgi:hypothetical protein